MKTKIAIVLVSLFFTSCLSYFLADENDMRVGIQIDVSNATKLEYENVKLTIGGMKDNNFVGTETYFLPKIQIRKDTTSSQYVATDYNRWKPNLNRVKEISDKAYFTVQLNGKAPVLLYDYNAADSTSLVSAEITKNGVLKNRYGGNLNIVFLKTSLNGHFFEQK